MRRVFCAPRLIACRRALLTRHHASSSFVHPPSAARSSAIDRIVEGPAVWDDVYAPIVSAYVHLPFCKRRCHYCDFPVVPTGEPDRQVVQDRFEEYIVRLCSEIEHQPKWNSTPLTTVFFGGGTPSLIPPAHLERVMDALKSCLGISHTAEITMEADPGTFDAQKLQEYMDIGVNRFSVGVQAFSQAALEMCGRSHSLSDVNLALEAVREVKPPSWSLDLISGLPGVSLQEWERTLQLAVDAQPSHMSIYDLQVEPGTAFDSWQQRGQISLPSEITSVQSWKKSREYLCAAGFEHYELSNFARPAHKCAHNMVYWNGYSYYAFGIGASSCIHGLRFTRPRDMKSWCHQVDHLDKCTSESHMHVSTNLMKRERLKEAVMLQLRLVRGINCTWLAAGFGRACTQQLLDALEPHVPAGTVVFEVDQMLATANEVMLAVDNDVASHVRLSDPDGLLLSNAMISDVFVALDQ
eukprot:jgi/Ulvmu1/4201/UM019_0180.1